MVMSAAPKLMTAITTLTEREQQVIRMRFGLDGHSGMTTTAIAKELNISAGRVGQLIRMALNKLRRRTR